MNREALLELAERIEGNAYMMRRFLHDTTLDDGMVELEVLGRCNNIDARVSRIRGELTRASSEAESNVHNITHVHVTGNRGDAA